MKNSWIIGVIILVISGSVSLLTLNGKLGNTSETDSARNQATTSGDWFKIPAVKETKTTSTKTYFDAHNGFQFTYYDRLDGKIFDIDTGISHNTYVLCGSRACFGLSLSLADHNSKKPISEQYQYPDELIKNNPDIQKKNTGTTSVGNLEAQRVSYDGGNTDNRYEFIHIPFENKLLTISRTGKDDDVVKKQFEKITESLTFLRPASNKPERYENSTCGYQFTYPGNWYVLSESDDSVLLTTFDPESPKQASSVGIALSFSAKVVNETDRQEIIRLADKSENISINGSEGKLYLHENMYAGGFDKIYYFPLENKKFLEISYYGPAAGGQFDKVVESLEFTQEAGSPYPDNWINVGESGNEKGELETFYNEEDIEVVNLPNGAGFRLGDAKPVAYIWTANYRWDGEGDVFSMFDLAATENVIKREGHAPVTVYEATAKYIDNDGYVAVINSKEHPRTEIFISNNIPNNRDALEAIVRNLD